jgi:hypothetical protein
MDANGHLRATDENVVDGDVDQLDNVANDTCHVSMMGPCYFGSVAQHTHDQETNANSLRDADELLLVRLCRGSVELFGIDARLHTGAAVHEESALLEELGGHTAHRLACIP